ncbi:MAG: HEAT repeat domain-containing protein [Acidobacteria bacterium]|nr:HEAT repeat domain-containing protein [Acidobacteriota bacterium]
MPTRFLLVSLLASVPLLAQPKVGLIEIYGLRKVPQDKVLKALGVSVDGPLPASKGDAEERIEAVEGIVRASLSAVCCDKGKVILYVGVEERGTTRFEFHDPPELELKVPEEVEKAWIGFLAAVEAAARNNDTAEDLTRGYSLMANAEARSIQERFLTFADQHYGPLRETARNAADPQQRSIAAYVLGYAKNRKQVADDLQYLMRDPEPAVRGSAMRALMAVAVLAELDPESGVRVPATWFVEMLNSVEFTDRTKAAVALVNLSEKRNGYTLQHLRERAMPALTEMAKWHSLNHALPAFILLGRVAGLPEQEIQDLWTKGDREALLRKLRDAGRKK